MLAKLKSHKGIVIFILIMFIMYGCLSYVSGFPFGFGKMIARHHIINYCEAIFPYEDVVLENLGYNIKTMSFETTAITENGKQFLSYDPKIGSIGDRKRAEDFSLKYGLYEWLSDVELPSHFVQLSIYTTTKDPYTLKHKLSIQIRERVEEMPVIDEDSEQADLTELAMTYYESLCEEKPDVAENLVGRRIIRTPYFTDNTIKGPPWTSIEVEIREGASLQLNDLLNADLVIK
ncbi:MAG: hypothetical protein ACK5H4_13515 [Lacrimispora sphenoides]